MDGLDQKESANRYDRLMPTSRRNRKHAGPFEADSNKKGSAAEHEFAKGLALDDILSVVDQMNRTYGIPNTRVSLDRMAQDIPPVKAIVAKFLRRTTEICNGGVFAREHPSLSDLGQDFVTLPGRMPRYRIPPESVNRNLRSVLEAALGTLVMLPSKDPKSEYGVDKTRSLIRSLSKMAGQMRTAVEFPDVIGRFDTEDRTRLSRLPTELALASGALERALSTTKRIKIKMDRSNPQIRFALYLIDWLEACTGNKGYESAKTLFDAAFKVSGKSVPKLVERLAIEMHDKRRIRRAWVQAISASPSHVR